jgi:hypothetical protein
MHAFSCVYFHSIREKISSLSAVVYFGMAQSLDKDVLVIKVHMRRQRPSLSACEEFIFAARRAEKTQRVEKVLEF